MEKRAKELMAAPIRSFHLPTYNEIPDVGLFLEQTTKFISEHLGPLDKIVITSSMISNYVKMKLVDSPVKKQYSRDQIAYLIFIAITKSVLPLEDIQVLIQIQRRTYSTSRAYTYFCTEMENMLRFVFGLENELNPIEPGASDEKVMLRNITIAVAHKVYLDKCCAVLRHSVGSEP